MALIFTETNFTKFVLDIWVGLNGVRVLSIVAMLLVFASSIFVLNMDVRAYNNFMKNGADVDMTNCDYIE